MKPWTNTHTVAILWLIAACLALGWIAGLVSIRAEEMKWSRVTPAPVKPVPAAACHLPEHGAWCP